MARIFRHFVEPLGRDICSVRPGECSSLQGKLLEVRQFGQRSENRPLPEGALQKSLYPSMTGCFDGWTVLSRERSFAAAVKRFRRLSLRSSLAWTVVALHANARSSFRVKNSNWLTKAWAETLQNGQNTEGRCRLG